MKNQSGITLIALVITIIVTLIILSISISSSFEALESMREHNFVTKMIALQERVDVFCDKYTVKEINEMGSTGSQEDKDFLNRLIKSNKDNHLKSWSILDNIVGNYRYFSIEDIENVIGFKDFDVPVFINPLTRNVIAREGVKIDGIVYYRQYDLSGGRTLDQPDLSTNSKLEVAVKTYNNKAELKLDKAYATVKCTLLSSEPPVTIINTKVYSNTDTIEITESGNYKLVATDFNRNMDDYVDETTTDANTVEEIKKQYGGVEKTSQVLSVVIVNKPVLVEGMTPIVYEPIDGGINQKVVSADSPDWYNYGPDTKKWANVRLNDGSIYVWIPRFAYKISHMEENKIGIKFLVDNTNITTEGKALENGYIVAPAFKDGSKLVSTNYANGEWDSEITGFWVAKFEAVKSADEYPRSVYDDQLLQVWKTTAQYAFIRCRKMESSALFFNNTVCGQVSGELGAERYGEFAIDNNNVDTHLMKNSEWGAVTYLTSSKYGNKNNFYQDSTYPNKAFNKEDKEIDGVNVAPSTTGNKYGIYGMSGGTPEITAGGINIKSIFNNTNTSTKYATKYINTTTIVGDAINNTEVKILNSITDEELLTYKLPDKPILLRGGSKAGGKLFIYQGTESDESYAFRPAIIVTIN